MLMKYCFCFLLISSGLFGQITTTELIQENRWIVNSGINLPAIKFHFAETENQNESSGYVELFSSFGVGLSLNFGKTTFRKDVSNNKIDTDNIKFSNVVGVQLGILYSSKVGNSDESNNLDYFSLYSGINILDLQLGIGKELGAKYQDSTGWFLSISYGIPIYKLTGKGSFLIDPSKKKKLENQKESTFTYTTLSK